MITSIQGMLTAASPLTAAVDVNGLGYEVNIPVTTAEKLPAIGATVRLHTHVVYREDAHTLYGFAGAEERDFFRLLIGHVAGVGPRTALSIMSRLSLPVLQGAIAAGDTALLAQCPGVGKKTAERLIIELRGKFGALGALPPAAGVAGPPAGGGSGESNRLHDAVLALLALGYKAADADRAVRQAARSLDPAATTEQLIKAALG